MQYFLPRKSKKNSTNLNRVLQTPDFIPANLPGNLLRMSLGPDVTNVASASMNNNVEITHNFVMTVNGTKQTPIINVLNGAKKNYIANNNASFRIGG